MSENKSILFIHHGAGLGGAPKSMAQLANKLKQEGFVVKALFLKQSDATQLLDGVEYDVVGLPLFYFNHSSRWYRWYEFPHVIYQLFSWVVTVFFVAPYWLIKIKPDVVYLNSSVLTDWLVVSNLLKIKNVIHIRETISVGYFGLRNKLIKSLLDNFADEVIFLSEHNRKRIGKLRTNNSVIHNYVIEFIDPKTFKSRKYDFIYVGGSREIKGIELIKGLLRDTEGLLFCLLGYYDDDFVREFGVYENITIKGAVQDPLNYINNSKALLFPATTPHFPRPVIEALACGTIPIMSDLDGADEIVTDAKNGLLFKNGDLSSLKNSIKRLDSLNREEMMLNGQLTFKESFSIKNEKEIINIIRRKAGC